MWPVPATIRTRFGERLSVPVTNTEPLVRAAP